MRCCEILSYIAAIISFLFLILSFYYDQQKRFSKCSILLGITGIFATISLFLFLINISVKFHHHWTKYSQNLYKFIVVSTISTIFAAYWHFIVSEYDDSYNFPYLRQNANFQTLNFDHTLKSYNGNNGYIIFFDHAMLLERSCKDSGNPFPIESILPSSINFNCGTGGYSVSIESNCGSGMNLDGSASISYIHSRIKLTLFNHTSICCKNPRQPTFQISFNETWFKEHSFLFGNKFPRMHFVINDGHELNENDIRLNFPNNANDTYRLISAEWRRVTKIDGREILHLDFLRAHEYTSGGRLWTFQLNSVYYPSRVFVQINGLSNCADTIDARIFEEKRVFTFALFLTSVGSGVTSALAVIGFCFPNSLPNRYVEFWDRPPDIQEMEYHETILSRKTSHDESYKLLNN